MIGRRCKARERLSRAPLIGRALRDASNVPPLPVVLKAFPSSSAVRPPGRPERRPAPTQPAPQRPPGAGGHGGRGTPGPIPNPEVKPASADGTAGATLWETRAPPAPGARCAGKGRGDAREAPGRGGPERVLFSFAGVSGSPRRQTGRRPPRGSGGLFAFGASRAGFAGLPAAFCMSLIRVARFRRVGVLEGGLRFDALGFRCLSPWLLAWPRARCQLTRLCRRASRPAVRYRWEVVSHVPEDAEHVSRHRAACNRGEFPALCR